ncbi:UNVERIFIED_CONTAM: hypothetical protein GTU68_008594 [Idotea baltica]|nr:hypothetical protein [Idotea baltica]
MNYKDAGVDIDAGEMLIKRIKNVAKSTARPEVINSLGGFILVSGTDGVGTKLRLALNLNKHTDIGIDLVAMCVNDLIVCGAEPLFFLDYYATGKLDVNVACEVITSIAHGCKLANCSLIGGETAEMPGMYEGEDYDLAGFCVGVVEKSNIIDGSTINAGDTLIALPSSGPHSNGYSLIRKIINDAQVDIQTEQIEGISLAELLMKPTRIYVQSLLSLIKKTNIVKGMVHVTGGGLIDNLPRVISKNLQSVIHTDSWKLPEIFNWLQKQGNVDTHEMYRVLNCGIGMVICVAQENTQEALKMLRENQESPWVIGHVDIIQENSDPVIFKDMSSKP